MADNQESVSAQLEAQIKELEALRSRAEELKMDTATLEGVDRKIEALTKERDAAIEVERVVQERAKADLRNDVADRIRSYAREGDRFMAARTALVGSLQRAVDGGAMTKEDVEQLRADLKITGE